MNRSAITRRALALLVSVGLLGWLVWRVSPERLLRAGAELDWKLLVPATVGMVFALYFWDAVCLPLVYRVDDQRWRYWQSLHLRGLSYLGGAIHYEVGQAALAWGIARLQRTSVARMLARTVVLAYHDIVVLLGLGLVGALLSDHPRTERIRPFIAIGFGGALGIAFIFWALPRVFGTAFRSKRLNTLFDGWSVQRSLQLIPLRVIYYGILVAYAAAALRICGVGVDHHVVLSTIPLVLLADGLPNVAGLGTRDTALQLLLQVDDRDKLLAMSLIWSTGLLVIRAAIGLVHLWIEQWFVGPLDESPTA